MTNADLYRFWFTDQSAPRAEWFKKDEAFDREIAKTFAPRIEANLAHAPADARERLTFILLFDQVPRNSFRNDPRSFAYDHRALELAREGLKAGDLDRLSTTESLFLLLPLEHSESIADQRECVRLMEGLLDRAPAELKTFAREILDFARKHERIIDRFGRFPHRNQILGRTSTADESKFLTEPGSRF